MRIVEIRSRQHETNAVIINRTLFSSTLHGFVRSRGCPPWTLSLMKSIFLETQEQGIKRVLWDNFHRSSDCREVIYRDVGTAIGTVTYDRLYQYWNRINSLAVGVAKIRDGVNAHNLSSQRLRKVIGGGRTGERVREENGVPPKCSTFELNGILNREGLFPAPFRVSILKSLIDHP